jgi:hypothetical protein
MGLGRKKEEREMATTTKVLVVAALLAGGCGNSGSGNGAGNPPFVPDLTENWTNQADASDLFFFTNEAPDASTGSFTGNEQPAAGGMLCYTGMFSNHAIDFTYDSDAGAKAGLKYAGQLTGDGTTWRMTLSGTAGQLVLTRPY